ncbi:MAG: zinc-finger domain-containing protein [Gammaproteobacteria bacterium]|nr:zinc-finger domain-containing protein [Gammaproteobacteria bacterium]
MENQAPKTGDTQGDKGGTQQPNAQNHYNVTRQDLPLHCPMSGMSLWNSHPRVYLSVENNGHAKCPYCGAEYTLEDN